MNYLLEIAAFNPESAYIAASAGADRIELCAGQSVGGLTPAMETILEVKRALSIPVVVMIRPKGGDFVYTEAEIGQMKHDLLQARALGADGFVFGILTPEGTIDEAANKALVALADPLPCTFHRAFDGLEDKVSAQETLIACGFQRLLTSGGLGKAPDYCTELHQLIQQAHGRITIMPGGGIRSSNIGRVLKATNAQEYHSAALTGDDDLADEAEIKALKLQII